MRDDWVDRLDLDAEPRVLGVAGPISSLATVRAVDARHREADADVRVDRPALDLRVDADHAAEAVEERAARVAVVDRRVRLDRARDGRPFGASMSRPVALTMPAVIVRSSPNGFPIAYTRVADQDAGGVGERQRVEGGRPCLHADDGDVRRRIGSDEGGGVGPPP